MTKKELRKKLEFELRVRRIVFDGLKKLNRLDDIKEYYYETRGYIQAYEFSYINGRGTKEKLLDLLDLYCRNNEIDSNEFMEQVTKLLA